MFEQAAARGTKAGDDNFYGKADLMRPAWAQLQIKLLSVSVSVCGNGRWGCGGGWLPPLASKDKRESGAAARN